MEVLVVALIPILQALCATLVAYLNKRRVSPELNINKLRRLLDEDDKTAVTNSIDEQSIRVQQALHNG